MIPRSTKRLTFVVGLQYSPKTYTYETNDIHVMYFVFSVDYKIRSKLTDWLAGIISIISAIHLHVCIVIVR